MAQWVIEATAPAQQVPGEIAPPDVGLRILKRLALRGLVRHTESGWVPQRVLAEPIELQQPDQEPYVELLETCWRLCTAGGRVLACEIFRIDGPGVEVRAGFRGEELLQSQWTSQIALARELATTWKQVALDQGGLEEVVATSFGEDQHGGTLRRGDRIVLDQNELTLDIEVAGDIATVRCAGRLTLVSIGRLRHEVKRLLLHARVITIDLTGLTMMDSMGLGTIAALYASAHNAGRELYVVNIGPRIREMFSVSRLLSLFEPPGEAKIP